MRKKVLYVFPTDWDARQLEACRPAWESRFEIEFAEPTDWDCPWDIDILGWIDSAAERWRGRIAGVTSSSDYPGATVAAALAQRLGLPGPTPQAVLGCSNKYLARLNQAAFVPEHTPAFDLLDPDDEAALPERCGFPCFVKPIKGAFSVMSGRIDSADDLAAFFARPSMREFRSEFVRIFNVLTEHFSNSEVDGRYFLAEGLLRGAQVTVEGYSTQDDVVILGVTDSEIEPGVGSFVRFVYPSRLPKHVQERMSDVAKRTIRGSGLRHSFFNIEMIYDAADDSLFIIEVNARICGQFGDVYQKVLGCNSYELALELATGAKPELPTSPGPHRFAASVPLRTFEPVRVARAPEALDVEAAESLFPDTMVWNECRSGQDMVDFESIEDGHSCRYGVINVGAPDYDSLSARADAVRERLGYRFEPVIR